MNSPSETPHKERSTACLQCGLPVATRRTLRTPSDQYCCYGCYLLHGLTGTRRNEERPTLFLARLGFSAFLAMNAQTFTWALYGEELPFLFPIEAESRQSLNYLVFVLSFPVYLLIGIPFVRNAIREIRNLSPGVDSLIAIGTTSAFLYSIYSTFTGSLAVYYDTATMVLVLVTFGRYLEATARVKAADAMGKIAVSGPAKARLICDGVEREVAADTLPIGAHVRVLPGEQIPVDGEVLGGESTVDESILTGEASPVSKSPGDSVFGGSINHDGCLEVKASRAANETYLSQLHKLVTEIMHSRSPSQELADRIARYFTPAVVLLAAGAAFFWGIKSDPAAGFLTGLSVLLIACPCGLGIGATLAASIGYARAARKGVIVRSFATLERIGKTSTVFIDKTGTLTEGKPSVEAVVPLSAGPTTENEILTLLASLETHSEHPTARAITDYAKSLEVRLRRVADFRYLPGVGVSGKVEDSNGQMVDVRISNKPPDGTGTYFAIPDPSPSSSVSYIYLNDLYSGYVSVRDSLRPSAGEAVKRLRMAGIEVQVLSGDEPRVVDHVGQEAGISKHHGGLTPIDKVSIVTSAHRQGKEVCMVGDGVNDAAALAAAGIGVTLGSGTSLARSSSDITILDSDLRKLSWIIQHGKRILRTIRWNFVWVFLYNVIGIGLAVTGQIRPVFAALAMVLSSVLIIANSSRLARVEPAR